MQLSLSQLCAVGLDCVCRWGVLADQRIHAGLLLCGCAGVYLVPTPLLCELCGGVITDPKHTQLSAGMGGLGTPSGVWGMGNRCLCVVGLWCGHGQG